MSSVSLVDSVPRNVQGHARQIESESQSLPESSLLDCPERTSGCRDDAPPVAEILE